MRRCFFDYLFDVSDDLGITFKTVNTNDFDIVPKKSYLKRKLTEKEEELKRFEAARNNSLKYYESVIVKINAEIDELKRKT